MNRRAFCKRLGALAGTVIASPLLRAWTPGEGPAVVYRPVVPNVPSGTATPIVPTRTATPVPAATPTPSVEAVMTKIALVKTGDRADGVRRACELLGAGGVRGNRVLLKPNFNSADVAPGSTHPDILRELVAQLQAMGAQAITVADRSGMGNTRVVMRQKGIFDLAQQSGLNVVVLDELAEKDWVPRQAHDQHWSQGFAVPRILLDAECVVQTCNVKTHRYGGYFTLSLKNSVGLAAKTTKSGGHNYMDELHGSPYQRQMIAELNTAYDPALIVMDGVEAFVDGGPDRGKKVSPQVVLAGTDRIAMDAAGVAILRLFGTTPEVSRGKIFELEQIARAVELGLGVDSPARIEFITADAESEAFAAQLRGLMTQ